MDPGPRTFHFSEFSPIGLSEIKGDATIAVCLPARNEEATVGEIVGRICHDLVEQIALVDDVVVVDDHSDDHTAARANEAGARVVAADAVPDYDDGPGKGAALWVSLHATKADIVVWIDADVTNFASHFVSGLVGPLLVDPDLVFSKAFYRRPTETGASGGRVTELVARPLLSLLFPELLGFHQPLSGEYAGRREALEQVPFEHGYGVEMGLLVDLSQRFGLARMGQVDLGARLHRHQSTHKLAKQATEVLHAALRRADPDLVADRAILRRVEHEPTHLSFMARPPLVTIGSYGSR